MSKLLRLPPETMRYLTIGAEFIGIFMAVFLVGYWLDSHVGYSPLFIFLGMIAGFAGAMYRLLRTAREYEASRRREEGNKRAAKDDNPGEEDDEDQTG